MFIPWDFRNFDVIQDFCKAILSNIKYIALETKYLLQIDKLFSTIVPAISFQKAVMFLAHETDLCVSKVYVPELDIVY